MVTGNVGSWVLLPDILILQDVDGGKEFAF